MDPSLNGYSPDRDKIFYRQLNAEISAIPGVRSVGLAALRILENNESDSWLTIEGYRAKPAETPLAFMNWIGPGYFTTLGIPLVAGRDFTENDRQTQKHGDRPDVSQDVARVVIVNEKFARRFFGSVEKAIGRHVGYGIDPGTKTDMEIVGVIKDIKYTSLRDEVPIQMFEPYLAQNFFSGMVRLHAYFHAARSVFCRGARSQYALLIPICRSTACGPWTSKSPIRC